MQRRPLHIACVSEKANSNWVWLKDRIDYPLLLVWFFFYTPNTVIDKLLRRPLMARLLEGLRLRRTAKRNGLDLIVTHLPYCTAWMATLLGKAKGKSYHLAFAFNFTDLPKGIRRWHMTRSFRLVDCFVVSSSMEKKLYSEYFTIPSEKFEVLIWGAAPPLHLAECAHVTKPFVASMGGEGRDYKTLIEVANILTDITFVLIVRPRSLAGLKVPPNVKVFVNIPAPEAWSLVYHSALSVIPLRTATTPNGHVTLVGGMHLGKAHVVTKSAGLTEYVVHNETALVVPPGDVMAMKEAIEQLLSDQVLTERLGNAARIFAMRHCNEQIVTKFFVDFLDRCFQLDRSRTH